MPCPPSELLPCSRNCKPVNPESSAITARAVHWVWTEQPLDGAGQQSASRRC